MDSFIFSARFAAWLWSTLALLLIVAGICAYVDFTNMATTLASLGFLVFLVGSGIGFADLTNP